MDTLTLLTVLTVVIAFLGIISSVYFGMINRPKKKQLRYRFTGDRVVKLGVGEPLKVTFDGRTVGDPHVMRIALASAGRDDISSDDFDGGRPIVFDIGSKILQISALDGGKSTHFVIGADEKSIEVAPDLFKPKQPEVSAVFVCDGPPKIAVFAYLKGAEVLPYKLNSELPWTFKIWPLPTLILFSGLVVAGMTILQQLDPSVDLLPRAGYIGAAFILLFALTTRLLLQVIQLQWSRKTVWTPTD